jgi:hypothetical protein
MAWELATRQLAAALPNSFGKKNFSGNFYLQARGRSLVSEVILTTPDDL